MINISEELLEKVCNKLLVCGELHCSYNHIGDEEYEYTLIDHITCVEFYFKKDFCGVIAKLVYSGSMVSNDTNLLLGFVHNKLIKQLEENSLKGLEHYVK